MKYQVIKQFHFNAAHRLKDYDWICNNIHWHNFVVKIKATGQKIEMWEKSWMVVDFKDMNRVRKRVDQNRDHAMLFQVRDEVWEAIAWFWLKHFAFEEAPTTENLCKYLYNFIGEEMWQDIDIQVEIRETPTCAAIYPII